MTFVAPLVAAGAGGLAFVAALSATSESVQPV